MSRQPINYKAQQLLQRQTSVKSNESFTDERLTGLASLRVPSQFSSPSSDRGTKCDRNIAVNSSHHSEEGNPTQLDLLRTRDQLNPRYLMSFEQNFSGNSSVPAVSRVSQQPSFESYDSSMSANSWASSNEMDAMNPALHESCEFSPSTSLPQASNRSLIAKQMDSYLESNTQASRCETNQSGLRIRINMDETKRQQRLTGKSGEQTASKNVDSLTKVQASLFTGNNKRSNDTLKIIGSEKDSVSDVKLQVGGGTPNIKGLWKRAFQSLRKDKSKREPSLSKRREPPSTSDEIDPVYHLLRCAASKSQATAITTSGFGTPKASDRTKSNTVESPLTPPGFANGSDSSMRSSSHAVTGVSSKKSSNVNFQPTYYTNFHPPTEVEKRKDMRMKTPDEVDYSTSSGFEMPRATTPNLQPDFFIKDSPLQLETGERILEGNAEDEKSREAQLAYEQHKRLNARRTMLKSTQKSLSFAVEDEINDSDNSVSINNRKNRVQNSVAQGLRVPLCERMKSLSVDDQHDIVEHKRWANNTGHQAQHAPQLRNQPLQSDHCHPRYAPIDKEFASKQPYKESRGKVTLLSTKSFSLDVPGTERSDENDRILSGSSSPGQMVVGSVVHDGRSKERFRGSVRKSLSPLSPVKRDSDYSTQYSGSDWHMNIQSQPNLGEHRQRHISQTQKHNSTIGHSIGTRLIGYGSSTGLTHHKGASYSRRNQSNVGTLYLVMNDFVPRRRDDLPLRAGQFVRVIENSDNLWWYGSCEGQLGYFPSTFVHQLMPNRM